MSVLSSLKSVPPRALLAAPALCTVLALGASGTALAQPTPGRSICTHTFHLTTQRCAQYARLRHAPVKSWLAPSAKAGTSLVYATQPFSNVVVVSSVTKDGLALAGQLSVGQNTVPIGMTVDGARQLYVAISALFGPPAVPSIVVYPPGATQPSTVYSQGLVGPIDVAVDRQGTVYAADLKQPGGGGCSSLSGASQIVEYAKGSQTPTATVNDVPGCLSAVAVDPHGNMYVTYVYYPASGLPQSDVLKYGPGSTKGTHLNLTAPGGTFFYDLTVDATGTIVIANILDDATVSQILTYASGATAPTSAFEYGGLDSWGPEYFALRGTQIFAPAYIAENVGSVVAQFDYPSGKERAVENPASVPPTFIYGFAASP